MRAVHVIELVLRSAVLNEPLTYVPERGATDAEISALSKRLPRPLSSLHVSLLKRWNGLNLDVVRVFGASPTPKELRGLNEVQSGPLAGMPGVVVFADDPSGFVYGEDDRGQILCLDTDCGKIEVVASTLDDFFVRLVFGDDAATFAGEKWRQDLRKAGLP